MYICDVLAVTTRRLISYLIFELNERKKVWSRMQKTRFDQTLIPLLRTDQED